MKFGFDTDPARAEVVAWTEGGTEAGDWARSASQSSGGQWLIRGQRYYLEALARSVPGEGRFEVGWTGPGLVGTNVLPAAVSVPVDLGYAPRLGSVEVAVAASATNGALVAQLAGLDSPLDTLVYRLPDAGPGGLFAVDPDTGRLLVANAAALAGLAGSNLTLRVEVQDSGYGGRYPLRSTEAILGVRVVDATPVARWVGRGDDGYWSTLANWTPDGPKEGGPLNFGRSPSDESERYPPAGGPGAFQRGGVPRARESPDAPGGPAEQRREHLGDRLPPGGGPGLHECLSHPDLERVHQQRRARPDAGGRELDPARRGIPWRRPVDQAQTGALVLAAANRHTGATRIEGGQLVLVGAGAILESGTVTLGSDAVLDVRDVAGGFVVGPNQVLRGQGRVVGAVTVLGRLEPEFVLPGGEITFGHGAVGFTFRNGAGELTFSNRLVLAGQLIITNRTSSGLSDGAGLRVSAGCMRRAADRPVAGPIPILPRGGFPAVVPGGSGDGSLRGGLAAAAGGRPRVGHEQPSDGRHPAGHLGLPRSSRSGW